MVIVHLQISDIGIDCEPITLNDGFTNVATALSRLTLLNGIQVNVNNLATQITATVVGQGPCVGTSLVIPIDFHPCATGPEPPPPPPLCVACYTVQTGTIPVSGGASSTSTGTITVTGCPVNVWAKYNSAGTNSGTANFGMTINSINATGVGTITGNGQTFYSNSNGSTGAGYITLAPGTYNYTLVKIDNYTSGNTVIFSYSTGTDPLSSINMQAC